MKRGRHSASTAELSPKQNLVNGVTLYLGAGMNKLAMAARPSSSGGERCKQGLLTLHGLETRKNLCRYPRNMNYS